MASEAGKGDRPRPMDISRDEFERRWERIQWRRDEHMQKSETRDEER